MLAEMVVRFVYCGVLVCCVCRDMQCNWWFVGLEEVELR